jgi:O-antigen ligase
MIGMLLTWGEHTPNLLKREPVQLGLAILSSGLIYLQPSLVLTIAAAVILFWIFFNHPDYGLTMTIFWAPFFLFPVELYVFAFPLSEILVGLTFGAWALRALSDLGKNAQDRLASFSLVVALRKLSAMDYAVAVWLLLGVLSLTWSEHYSQAMTELRTMIIEPTLFYIVLRASIRTSSMAVTLVDGLLLAGFIVAAISLWQFTQGQTVILAEAGTARLAGIYGSPNNLALFLGRCVPFALAYLILSNDRIRRFAAAGSLPVMLLAVVLTQSVGAIFLGVPFAFATIFLLIGRRRALLVLFGLFGITAAVFLLLFQSARFTRLLDMSSGTNFFRIRVWQSAINMIRDYPLTGIGLDQFLYAFRGQYIMPDAWQEPELSHPHNVFLDFWLRLGLLGLLNFLWVQVLFWCTFREIYEWFRGRDSLPFALAVGAAGSMANLLSHGMVDNSVFVQDLCYVYVLLLGLVMNLSNIRTIDETNDIMV